MYLLYLDESGVTQRHLSQTSHYILLGMAVHEGTWFALNRRIFELKREYALGDPADLELHAAWLRRAIPEQSQIPGFEKLGYQARFNAVMQLRGAAGVAESLVPGARARYERNRYEKETRSLVHLTREEREQLFDRALAIVGDYRKGALTLFAEAIDKGALRPELDPFDQAFTQVVTRFEFFLKRRKEKTWGILVVDHDPHRAAGLTQLLARFQRSGTRWTAVERVIEAPFFLDSKRTAGVQVVDLCAYVLRRYLENREEQRFQVIFDKFDRTESKLHGLRHYTSRGCRCLICRERGHSEETSGK